MRKDSNKTTTYGVGTDQRADGKLRVQLFKASHTFTISNKTINEFAFGITRHVSDVGAGPSTLPRFELSCVDQAFAVPGPARFKQFRTGTVYHFLDTLGSVRGNHSFKAGGDIRLNRRSASSANQETLIFFALNDFRDNVPFIVSRGGNPLLDYANENVSLFLQDDWKAHPRLSLNLGLRYDVSAVRREKEGRLQNFDLNTLKFTPRGQKLHDVDKNNFGPRFVFAFDVFAPQKTVLRAGYGIFYDRDLPASFGSPQANTFPAESVDLFTALFICGIFPQYPVDHAAYKCAVPNDYSIERHLQTAMAQHWSLDVQQDLGFGTLQVGYVGNHVTHLLTNGVVTPRNINRRNPVTQARPLSANFGDIFLVGGYPQSNYNALQVTFKRNLAKGLRFNANYTWSHAIDDVVGFFRVYQDENNARAERASTDQDDSHNFTFDAGYDLPLPDWFDCGPPLLGSPLPLTRLTEIRNGPSAQVARLGGVFCRF